MRGRQDQGGFTYMVVLAFMFVLGLGLAEVGQLWRDASLRDREKDLLFAGRQFRRAIESYAQQSPGTPDLPRTLEDLLEDRRFPVVKRHLRRIYVDPMTGKADWKLIRQGDRIIGVESRSEGTPFRKIDFETNEDEFADAQTYAQWRFQYRPVAPIVAGGVNPVSSGAPAANPSTSAPGTAAPVLAAQAPPLPPSVKRTTERCDDRRVDDLQTCGAARDAGASVQAVARCTASATSRFAACISGRSPPALRVPVTEVQGR